MLEKTFYGTVTLISMVMAVVLFTLPTTSDTLKPDETGKSLLITNVRIFDGERMLEPSSLLVKDGLIVSIGEPGNDSQATVIDGSGKTLLPGLIDSHTHSYGDSLTVTTNFGVTTHLDMFGSADLLTSEKIRRQSTKPTHKADLFSAGVLATVPGGHGTQFGLSVETISRPEEAPIWVANRVAEGSDYIKLVYMPDDPHFASLDLPTASALIREAHENGLLALAHISTQAAAQALLDQGIDGLVHIFADEPVSKSFLLQAKKQKLFVIPTLSVISTVNKLEQAQRLAADTRVAPYLQPGQTQQLLTDFGEGHWSGFDYQVALSNTKQMHNAGIPILAGSDAPNPGTSYGVSLHQEIALLVEAGMTPLEALRAATSVPVDALGISDRGRIRPGQRADFLLIDGEPDKAITNTLSIHSVFKNGQEIPRRLSKSQSAAAKTSSDKLSNFSQSLTSSAGMIWIKTGDSMMNGKSTSILELKNSALRVNAEVKQGFMFPWAGAGAFSNEPVDISQYKSIEITVRGTSGSYSLMTFSGSQAGVPPTQTFKVEKHWQTHTFLLADFPGLMPGRFNGLSIVAGPELGRFEYYIKNVKLLR